MIKINVNYSDNFLARYEKHVVTERLLPSFNDMIEQIPEEQQERVLELFSDEFIRELVLCRANELHLKIIAIYDHLHELSERYCLEYYLKDLELTPVEATMKITRDDEKEQIRLIHRRVVADLEVLSNDRQSKLLPSVIDNMQDTTIASEVKKQLKLINSMKTGTYDLSNEEVNLFSNWINEFSGIFNYNAMSRVFGREITNSLDLDVCPYCNNEDIETINEVGAETRPDLDHFFPKSKFPFLGLTLSNIIPAGTRCNQKYKSDKSMFDHVHPYIDGINQTTLFDFNYIFDEGRNIDAINITVNKQNNELDNNLDLFKVKECHNKNNVKTWFMRLEECYQHLSNSNPEFLNAILDDDNLIRTLLQIDIHESPSKEQYQKLKIDALNYLSGRHYEISG
ncbi:hypothetical protein C4G33_RS05980 [Vibrio parahaemolyticus]|nr:hypothetical protein [Vibrio parahaemolyticus]